MSLSETIRNKLARQRERQDRPKRWVMYVLGLLIAVLLVGLIVRPILFTDITLAPEFETLSLDGVPELSPNGSADFVVSKRLLQRVTRLSIVGEGEIHDHSWFALSVPDDASPSCPQIDLVPGASGGGATLTIIPRGSPKCGLSIQTAPRSTRTPAPSRALKEGQQLLLSLGGMKVGTPQATVILFERSKANALSGRLAAPLAFLGEKLEGKCSGTELGRLSAPALSLRKVHLDATGAEPKLRADLVLDDVSALTIDGHDCRYNVFHQLARSSALKQIGELTISSLLGMILGLVLARRKWKP